MKKIIFTLFIFFAISSFAQEGFYLLTTMSGDSVGDQFSVVSHIGDVNADGFDDVIVGAPGGDYAKLFFGGAVFDTIPDLIFRDYKQYNCQFGCSFASDGDVNGDGYPDLIIGASSTWIEWMVTGAAYVYFGGPTIDTTADLTLIVGVWPEYGWQYGFGKSVAIPGDMNGDGYDDFVAGAANDDIDAHGRVFLYYGGPNVDDQWDVLLEGEEVFDNFGFSLSKVGDMNDDGLDDLLIGAPMFHNNIPGKNYQGGKAYLLFSRDPLVLHNSIEYTGDTSSYYYGVSLSKLGDVNGDSINDLGIMGGEYFKIISGIDFQHIITVYADTNNFGSYYNISAANDINNDGFNDVFIGMYKAINGEGVNSVIVYLGGEIIDSIPDFEIINDENISFTSSGYLGKINEGNNKDYIISGYDWYGGNTPGPGKVYIYSYGLPDGIENDFNSNFLSNYDLLQNYPNPFNPSTSIQYAISDRQFVTLKVYDVLGKEIATLVNEEKSAGSYEIDFNASHLVSGIYYYQLRAGDCVETKKMILLK